MFFCKVFVGIFLLKVLNFVFLIVYIACLLLCFFQYTLGMVLGWLRRVLIVLLVLDLTLIVFLAINPPRKKITLAGSSTVFPLAHRWGDLYMDYYPNVSVEVTGGGSGLGILAAGEHTVDIGMASHPLEPDQRRKFPNLVEIPIALDGVAIVANKNVNDSLKLTREMIVSIFSGKIKTWEEFSKMFNVNIKAKGDIIVCVRADKSGTTDVFSKWLSLDPSWGLGHGEVISWPKSRRFVSGNGNQEVLINVRNNPNAIGYVGLAYTQESGVVVAEILNPSIGEYVAPSADSVRRAAEKTVSMVNESLFDANISGAYPIARALYFIVDGKYVKSKVHVVKFIAWVLDPKGGQIAEIVRGVGYVEISGTILHRMALLIINEFCSRGSG